MASPQDESALLEVNGEYDEEAALEAAIAMSLGKPISSSTQPPPTTVKSPRADGATPPSPVLANSFGPLGLDRKKMEAERLARQRKRTATEADLDEAARPRAASTALPHATTLSHVTARSIARQTGDLPFAKGAVKRTWVSGHAWTDQDIKIEDIFMKDELELAVLSSFQWDEDWLLSKIDISRSRLVLIAFANNEAQQREMEGNVPGSRIRFCFPPMTGGGYLHSKIQLLKFKHHLRIAVPSGNLVPYDWGETGKLENTVFLIDLPLLKTVESQRGPPPTSFGTELRRFLRAQGLDESLVLSLDKYDFTETRRYGFVHSISGSHTNGALKQTGYCGLGRVVNDLGLANLQPVNIHYVTSSLGAIDEQFLTAIYYACQGDSGMKEYEDRQNKSKNSKPKSTVSGVGLSNRAAQVPPLADRFRIFFPSSRTVAASIGGKAAAGTICFQERWWKSSTFPRELLRDAVNTRRGVLMHSKIMFVSTGSRDTAGQAWAYVGSANLSESAWGRLVKDRRTGLAKLTCRNWECGVIVPVNTSMEADTETPNSGDLDVFRGKVPVPIELPGEAFSTEALPTEEQRQPWFFQTSGSD